MNVPFLRTLTGIAGEPTCVVSGTLDPKRFDIPATLVGHAPGVIPTKAEVDGKPLPIHVTEGVIQVPASRSATPILIS